MLISVVVPVYNLENELERCILSIINQTYKDLEIILVNDGSTDDSLKICKRFAKIDSRIVVIDQENSGLYGARRTGVFAAKGEYIGHVDGDDWIEAQYFENLYKATQNGRIDVVISNMMEHGGENVPKKWVNGVPSGLYVGSEIENKIHPIMMENDNNGNNYIMPSLCSKLFRRVLNVNNQVMENGIRCDEDNLNTYLMLFEAKSICITDDCMYHYIRRTGSLTNGGMSWEQTLASIKLVDKLLYQKFYTCKLHKILCKQLKRYTAFRIYNELEKNFGIHAKQYIFPYEMIEKGSKIILYGAGDIGRSFFLQLEKNKYAKVVLWVDKNYKRVDIRYADVCPPENIEYCCDYDYIVVCMKSKNAVTVINMLTEKKVCANRIIWKKDYFMEADYLWYD